MAIFFASETTDSLGDYEKGTWTVTMNKAGTGGNADSQLSARQAFYERVGDLLWISFYWYSGNLNFGNTNGAWYVSGLPFNVLTLTNGAYQFIQGGYLYSNGHPSAYSAGYRWQSNNTNGPNTLQIYSSNYNSNAGGGAWEFSGCGCLRIQ